MKPLQRQSVEYSNLEIAKSSEALIFLRSAKVGLRRIILLSFLFSVAVA